MNKRNIGKEIEAKIKDEDDAIHPEEDSEATCYAEIIQSKITIMRRNGRIVGVVLSWED